MNSFSIKCNSTQIYTTRSFARGPRYRKRNLFGMPRFNILEKSFLEWLIHFSCNGGKFEAISINFEAPDVVLPNFGTSKKCSKIFVGDQVEDFEEVQ